MSETTVLAAFKTLLTGEPTLAPLVSAVYTDIPQFPYAGAWPFVVVQPATQVSDVITNADVQQHGDYIVMYFDELGDRSQETVAQIMAAARAFAITLRLAIRRDKTLGGAVVSAGEYTGIATHYSEAGILRNVVDQPAYYLPTSVHVLDFPEPYY